MFYAWPGLEFLDTALTAQHRSETEHLFSSSDSCSSVASASRASQRCFSIERPKDLLILLIPVHPWHLRPAQASAVSASNAQRTF
jgi:hypothetical protein